MNPLPDTVPLPEEVQPKSHPRRRPAHRSVSLRHSLSATGLPPKAPTFHQPEASPPESPSATASDKANPPSTLSPRFLSNRHSSGESSDAGKWFESSNTNALQSNASFADSNDPPFFLRNSSSGDSPPDGHVLHDPNYQPKTSMPHRPALTHFVTDGSSSEDFRGVIDDLTVANRKLKQKLRKYEKLNDSHLQDDKLFEVRFHGLPDHKKKELEDTLRKFASGLSPTSNSPPNPTLHQPPPFDPQKTASSYASKFADSGYASISASGQNSISAPSNQASNRASNRMPSGDTDRHRMTKSQYSQQQQQSIQSYLHDIPVGLLPKRHAPMTDKSKKKLVVRRLEQIFAGKLSAPGSHPQPMQQEEVAQSAAMADRQAKEATGHRFRSEGHREARIMPVQANDEDITAHVTGETLNRLRPHLNVSEQDFAGSGSPDQRPTRPLDLDLFRAQVPAENMEYIRHLGFTPPDMDTGEAPELGHGWLYLNLLINMAQLHTFNVTPDFVKDAVAEYSSKFELSHDGRKIRWKGGLDESKVSSGSSSEHLSGDSPSGSVLIGNGKSPFKDLKTGHRGSSVSSLDPERAARRLARTRKQKEREKFSYIPIFFHKEDSEEDEDYYGYKMDSSNTSLLQPLQPGDSSGLDGSAMRSSSSKKRRENGPMIFYNKANFCTDLSGDARGLSSYSSSQYNSLTTHPLGVSPASHGMGKQYSAGITESRLSRDSTVMYVGRKAGSRTTSSDGDLDFDPEALANDNGTESPDTVEFEASGLGGVQPDDNFSIKVRRSQVQSASTVDPFARRKSEFYPKHIREALDGQSTHKAGVSWSKQSQPIIKEEILSASRKSLPSSTLPPASFLPFDSTSSGDVDSDLDSDVSSNPSTTSSSGNGLASAQRMSNMSPAETGDQNEDYNDDSEGGVEEGEGGEEDSDSEDYDSDDYDSDDSIDLLATAREMDPKTVRRSEREYDAAIADRLAEIIPAGSSAATACGGSGFQSPADADMDMPAQPPNRTTRRSTTSGSLSSRSRLKRTRTGNTSGTDVQGSKGRKSQKIR
ncbi:hypothetical protein P280DRAFT_452167 [Massarina eburnea CBS 473.64]|uniref:Frequency clock protein n=1 Tax=Massarina eburnea CBS 473.64 TaxID=1395130 RepID=A0A6A6RWH8_9PLEO|nr:hypothetical protein P280DRAFT_452167 [Massarina eburnea CBS 473.64]